MSSDKKKVKLLENSVILKRKNEKKNDTRKKKI